MCRNIVNNNNNFNEQTNTLLYQNISLTFYSRKSWCWLCGDGDRLLHIDPKFFWPLQHFFLILAGLLNRGSLRTQSPLSAAGSQFGIFLQLAPTPTDSSRLCPGSAVPSLISTGASLDWRLGRGSICYSSSLLPISETIKVETNKTSWTLPEKQGQTYNVLQCTSTQGHTSVGQLSKTSIYEFYTNIGCRGEHLSRVKVTWDR